MPIEVKQLMGMIDTDSPNENIGAGSVRMARNVEWFGQIPDMRPQSVMGTNLLPNALLSGTGIELTIWCYYDGVKKRLFFWNYNSAGNHGIYIYNTLTGLFQILVQNGSTTNGDVLGFTATGRIHSVGIIYGDPNDGDLLVFIDSLGRLRKANVLRFLNGSYNAGGKLIQSAYLTVIKAPPIPPIQATYENDTTVAANNTINALFNFCSTFLYDDFEQSVLASACRQPLPSQPYDPAHDSVTSSNARIALYIPTGDQNVTKLRIYGKQTKDGATTDWFIIDTLIKADLNIPDNTVYRYLFYNNGNYIAADPQFTVLDYDYVGLQHNTMEILNGNVISTAGITEGYNYFNPAMSVATSNVQAPAYSINGTLFFAATNGLFTSGQPQITLYLTGVGTNDGFGNPTQVGQTPAFFAVRAKSGNTDISFTFNNTGEDADIPSLLSSLSAAATTAGWVVDGTGTNTLTIHYPTGSVVLQSYYILGLTPNISPFVSPISCHFPQSSYAYAPLYRDENGVTNGVIGNTTGQLVTQVNGPAGQIPKVSINLAGVAPPAWAKYYEIVRTDTLTFNKYLDWISNAAYQGTGLGVNTQYAYFGISNIATYNTSINATEGVISYGFSPGDRIKILGRYDAHGNFTALNLDYAILGVVINPVANGIVQIGTFIQIYYPASDISGNFAFPIISNDTDFQNYQVLIYSYKAFVPTSQNVYFQIGQQYGIGNPGTNTAYHMGNIADNVVEITDGDVYYRQRTIPIQNSYFVPTGSYPQGTTYSTEWVNPGGNNIPIVDNGIWSITGDVHQNAGLGSTQFPNYSNTGTDVSNESTTDTLSVRLRGSQTIVDVTDPNGQFAKYVKVVLPGNLVSITQIVPLQTGLQPGVAQTVVFDATIQLPPLGKLWIINYTVNQIQIGGILLEIDIIRNITINVFDASFSDIYNIKTNSDNKPNIINIDAKTTYFSTLFRYSLPYQASTNLNNSNRFYPANFDEFSKQWGSVQRMYTWGKRLRVFQERKTGEVGVFSKFIVNQTGQVDLIASDTIITPDNIQYFEGDFGIGNQPSSLIISGYQNYFPDPIRGAWLRISLDGVKNISEEFMAQTFAGSSLTNYLNQFNYQFGGNAVMIGTYNFKKNKDGEVLFVMQAGSNGGLSIPGQTMAFNERKNSFTGVYDFAPDSIVCCENQLYSFRNGQLYIHNNSTPTGYCNFYGTPFKSSVSLVFNDQKKIKKTFMTSGHQTYMNKKWGALLVGDIETSFVDEQSNLQQISQLLPTDSSIEEGEVSGALLQDANSLPNPQTALLDGNYLKGFWLSMTLTAPDNGFNFLYLPFLRWEASVKTP